MSYSVRHRECPRGNEAAVASVHIDGANTAYRQAVRDGHAPLIEEYRAKIRAGAWPRWYVDALCQPYGGITPEQAFMFAKLHTLAARGAIGIVPIYVGASPGRDCDRDGNESKTSVLPDPFAAWIDPDQSNDFYGDGTLRWTEPIEVASGCTCCHASSESTLWVPPGSCSLEIGTCPASRVLLYVCDSGSVARWSYGQDRMYLIVGLPSPIEFVANRRWALESEGGAETWVEAVKAAVGEQISLFGVRPTTTDKTRPARSPRRVPDPRKAHTHGRSRPAR